MRLVCGPAGSGKTFRCLAEIRESLCAAPEGPPLLLITPKQTTYLLERQLLSDPALPGYTRLQILSFERLAHSIFKSLGRASPEMLDEQGRLMVLRAILAKKRNTLKLFRASARLNGFAQQLSQVLGEMQRKQLTPESLNAIAERVQHIPALSYKLQDLATLLKEYLDWLGTHQLQDADSLLTAATEALTDPVKVETGKRGAEESQLDLFPTKSRPLLFDRLWVDGFAQLSEQQIALLAALMPYGREGTMMFCLDKLAREEVSWLSTWSFVGKTVRDCRTRLSKVSGLELSTEILRRDPTRNRFTGNPVLQHLEQFWSEPQPYERMVAKKTLEAASNISPAETIRVASCANLEAEGVLAAREILRHVRTGGRFREVTVVVRELKGYHETLQRVFSRYQIPFFMDQRESVSHHPLPELTRNGLRTVAFDWLHEDWFAALKTGLIPAAEGEIDKLENEALARGWKGAIWQTSMVIAHDPDLTSWLESWRQRALPAFQQLAFRLGAPQGRSTGPELAGALREFWNILRIEEQLQSWTEGEPVSSDTGTPNSVHATVWQEMNALLQNVELAFANEPMALREWLPVLEAGIGNLTVGVIPPALDQVMVGAIDRSRNPEIKLAIVLGLNEGVFPAPPGSPVLLNESDYLELEKHDCSLTFTSRQQLGRERFLGYIALTRARERLVLSSALQDANGSPLNPSPFLRQLSRLFPTLQFENTPERIDLGQCEHANEVIGKLLRMRRPGHSASAPASPSPIQLEKIPGLSNVFERLENFEEIQPETTLNPEWAARLFGPKLRTSVSRMEEFAACPFKFFVHSGLRAEERKLFDLDVKEQGSFQHDVLALFHEQLRKEHKRWRDITAPEARALISQLAGGLAATYRDGLLHASDRSKFLLRLMTESLQDFIETLIHWMRGQYQFDPVAVELPFGDEQIGEPWELELGNDFRLAVQGRIDRVDAHLEPGSDQAHCVVVDYKSRERKLDPVLLANGLQLQLLAYLAVVRRWRNPLEFFGARKLIPAGVFYVSLRGKYKVQPNRHSALEDVKDARQLAYRHSGRFNIDALPLLDNRPGAKSGDQFNYRRNGNGELSKNSREALTSAAFEALLDSIESQLKQMGQKIFSGVVEVAPYKKGAITACHQCHYQGVCRIDPWTHHYRVLTRDKAS